MSLKLKEIDFSCTRFILFDLQIGIKQKKKHTGSWNKCIYSILGDKGSIEMINAL